MYYFEEEERSQWIKDLDEELAEDLEGLEDEETDVYYFIAREYTGVKVAEINESKSYRKVRKANDVESFLYNSIEEIKDAWNVPGRAPGYHRKMQQKLRKEWPVLAAALDRL